MLRSVPVFVMLLALSGACASESSTPSEPLDIARYDTLVTAHDWLDALAEAGQKGLEQGVYARQVYLSRTTEDERNQFVAATGVQSLSGPVSEWMVAEQLHMLGRFAEAAQRYDAIFNQATPLFPKSRIAFRRALAESEILLKEDVAVFELDKKAELLDRLLAVESALPRDGWMRDFQYRIVFLQYLLDRTDLDRVARLAEQVDVVWSQDNENDRLINGTILYMAKDAFIRAGRHDEANALISKLVRFDQVYGTNYGTGESGSY